MPVVSIHQWPAFLEPEEQGAHLTDERILGTLSS
jgi:hypothetical protein